jgi:hypothetical protein
VDVGVGASSDARASRRLPAAAVVAETRPGSPAHHRVGSRSADVGVAEPYWIGKSTIPHASARALLSATDESQGLRERFFGGLIGRAGGLEGLTTGSCELGLVAGEG